MQKKFETFFNQIETEEDDYKGLLTGLNQLDRRLRDVCSSSMEEATRHLNLEEGQTEVAAIRTLSAKFDMILEAVEQTTFPVVFETSKNSFILKFSDFELTGVLNNPLLSPKMDSLPRRKISNRSKGEEFDMKLNRLDSPRRLTSVGGSGKFGTDESGSSIKDQRISQILGARITKPISAFNSAGRSSLHGKSASQYLNFSQKLQKTSDDNLNLSGFKRGRGITQTTEPVNNDVEILANINNIYASLKRNTLSPAEETTDMAESKVKFLQTFDKVKLESNEITNRLKESAGSSIPKRSNFGLRLPSKPPSVVSVQKPGFSSIIPRKTLSYHTNLLSVTENYGILTNQSIDETKLRVIIFTIKNAPKHIESIDIYNNTFKINPVASLRKSIEERLPFSVFLDFDKNKMECNTEVKRRDVEFLALMNVNILGYEK